MSTTTEARLRELGQHLYVAAEPVTLAEVRQHRSGTVDLAGEPEPTTLVRATPAQRRSGGVRLAVILTAAAALLAVLFVINRDGRSHPTPTTSSSSFDGRAMLDPLPAGWKVDSAEENRRAAGSDVFISRIYAVSHDQPQNGRALEVVAIDTDAGTPAIPDNAATIDVNGSQGRIYSDEQARRTISFDRDGHWFSLIAQQFTDAELLTAAEHTQLDPGGYGAVVDASGLPTGVVVQGAGTRDEAWFLSQRSLSAPIPVVHWSNGNKTLWVETLDDPDAAGLQLLWAANVTPATVQAQPASLVTINNQPTFNGIVWTQDQHTVLLGSQQLTPDGLVALANTLRNTDPTEWATMIAASQPPVASLDPDTGLPAPGSAIPTGVTKFPIIDDAVVPDNGAGLTYAYYSNYPPGIDTTGTSWGGAVRITPPGGTAQTIRITVSDPSNAEQLPTVPGRTPGVAEYTYSGGAQLVTTTDGYTVAVQGQDIDSLYELIATVRPRIDDGKLTGYSVDDQGSDRFSEIAAPYEHNFATGAFPVVSVHNGAVTITVDPTPALNMATTMIGALEPVTTNHGSGYLYTAPGNAYLSLFITLDDGTTLHLESSQLNREQLLAASNAVQLTDETTWRRRYQPMLAVVPQTTGATTVPA